MKAYSTQNIRNVVLLGSTKSGICKPLDSHLKVFCSCSLFNVTFDSFCTINAPAPKFSA